LGEFEVSRIWLKFMGVCEGWFAKHKPDDELYTKAQIDGF
jgi:hypothetical protein